MEQLLTTYLQSSDSDFAIHYHIGNEFRGTTEMELAGDGSYALASTVTENRQELKFEGKVEPKKVHEIAEEMKVQALWEVTHIRPRPGDGEATARISVAGQGESYVVELWSGEIRKVPAFGAVQEKLLELVRRISEDKILEVGR